MFVLDRFQQNDDLASVLPERRKGPNFRRAGFIVTEYVEIAVIRPQFKKQTSVSVPLIQNLLDQVIGSVQLKPNGFS